MRHELTVQSRWKDRPPSHEESSESRWPDSLPMNLFEWINVVVMWWEGLLLMIRSLILIPSSATNLAVWSWLSHLWTSVFLIVKTGNDEDLQGSQHPIMKFYVSMTHEEESGERRDSLVPLLWGGRGRKYRGKEMDSEFTSFPSSENSTWGSDSERHQEDMELEQVREGGSARWGSPGTQLSWFISSALLLISLEAFSPFPISRYSFLNLLVSVLF